MGVYSDVEVLKFGCPGLAISRGELPNRWVRFGYVSACSDAGNPVATGQSWRNSLASHHGVARVQPSMPQFPLVPAECLGAGSDKLSLCRG